MLTKIIEFSVRNKLIIGLFVIALIGYGVYNITKLPIDAVPDITNNQVQVITVAPSFGATDIERLIGEVRSTVLDKTGFDLQAEVRIVGDAA